MDSSPLRNLRKCKVPSEGGGWVDRWMGGWVDGWMGDG